MRREYHQTIFQKKIFYSLESVNSLILIRLLSGDFNQLVQSFIWWKRFSYYHPSSTVEGMDKGYPGFSGWHFFCWDVRKKSIILEENHPSSIALCLGLPVRYPTGLYLSRTYSHRSTLWRTDFLKKCCKPGEGWGDKLLDVNYFWIVLLRVEIIIYI